MDAKILTSELELLVWMHEHANAYGQSGAWYAGNIADAMGMSLDALTKDASFLAGYDLVGMAFLDFSASGTENPFRIPQEIWLTSPGENYVRILEGRPGVMQRLTVGTLKKLGDVAVKAAGTLLAEVVKQQIRSLP